MPQSSTRAVGLDVPHEPIAVAEVAKEHGAEGLSLGTVGTRHCTIDRLIRNRPSKATQRVFVCEAGPCGDWLARDPRRTGDEGWVVAPSLMPKKASGRVKTDRRDAVPLARLRRSGDLTPVSVAAVEDEAVRDLARARADARRDLKAAKPRLKAVLLRQGTRDAGRAHWGPAPWRWPREVGGPPPAPQIVFHEEVRAVSEHHERPQRLEAERQGHVPAWRLSPAVRALQALRGAQCTGAVTLLAERGDWTRCGPPRPLMSSPGLTPREYSRGERRRQGPLTKAGHTVARRALVEGAWASRDSRQGQPPSASALGAGTKGHPGQRVEGPGAVMHALPVPQRTGETYQPRGGGDGPGHGRLPHGRSPVRCHAHAHCRICAP